MGCLLDSERADANPVEKMRAPSVLLATVGMAHRRLRDDRRCVVPRPTAAAAAAAHDEHHRLFAPTLLRVVRGSNPSQPHGRLRAILYRRSYRRSDLPAKRVLEPRERCVRRPRRWGRARRGISPRFALICTPRSQQTNTQAARRAVTADAWGSGADSAVLGSAALYQWLCRQRRGSRSVRHPRDHAWELVAD